MEDDEPFTKRYTTGDKPLPAVEDAAAMYMAASHVLTERGWVRLYTDYLNRD